MPSYGSRPTNLPEVFERALGEAVDYAGLFPPAALDMPEAVANYARYVGGSECWIVGRFVVPMARMESFLEQAERWHTGLSGAPWELSALLPGKADDGDVVHAFNQTHHGRFAIASIEVRMTALAAEVGDGFSGSASQHIQRYVDALPDRVEPWVEVDLSRDVESQVEDIKAAGAFAKVRTGGVEEHMIPAPAEVARFLMAVGAAGIRFKATAGLHHPLRGEYPLTYAPDAPRGTMFGYLNMFLASAVQGAGGSLDDVIRALEERSAKAFSSVDGELVWGDYRFSPETFEALRETALSSFGSCSVEEPHDELFSLNTNWAPAKE